MACFILIALYVQYELSFDRYHENSERIFRVAQELRGHVHEGHELLAMAPAPVGPLLKEQYPEVLTYTRLRITHNIPLAHEDKNFIETDIHFSDPDIFRIFTLDFTDGNPGSVFNDPFSVVLSERMAEKYFGNENPVGKTIRFRNSYDFNVTGIIKDMPENSHFIMDIVMPISAYGIIYNTNLTDWRNISCYTYILLDDRANSVMINDRIYDLLKDHTANSHGEYNRLFIQPLTKIHLYSKMDAELSPNNDIRIVYLFSLIAALIVLIACINYMNLATARSANRAREVGIRKVVGAQKAQLTKQFLGESVLITVIALILSFVIVSFILPFYNNFIERNLKFNLFQNYQIVLILFLLTIFIGLFAGSYPAVFISRFQPVQALRNILQKGSKGKNLRSFLVIGQFTVSIILIISTIIIRDQLFYIKNTDLGYNRKNIVVINTIDNDFRSKLDIIKSELVKHPDIYLTSSANFLPYWIRNQTIFNWPGRQENERIGTYCGSVDYDYVDLFGIDIVQGRSFSRDFPSDAEGAFLINETAARRLGWENPVGRELIHWSGKKGKIVGVMKNFNFHSLYQDIEALHLFHGRQDNHYQLALKISGNNIPNVLNFIKGKIEKIVPGYTVEHNFFEDMFNRTYKSEAKLESMLTVFALLGVFISCLGLFGLSSITIFYRTKEIGVRKVFGASVQRIVFFLSKDFLKLILIANIIAWPAAWILMNNWLQNFAFKTNIGILTFLSAVFLALFITFLTICVQTIKAAGANPVESLKYE